MDQEQLSELALLKATFSESYKLQWKQNTAPFNFSVCELLLGLDKSYN